MAAETFKTLAQVALIAGPTVGIIYTAPAAGQAIIKALFIVNVAGTTQVVKMFQNDEEDTNLVLAPTTLLAGEYGTYDGAITLNAGSTFLGNCSTASGVIVTVEGVEIT